MHIFGKPWDAPVCEDAIEAPTPVGTWCLRCGETIVEGDRGMLMGMIGEVEPWYLVSTGEGGVVVAEHAECQLSGVAGHLVGVCACTGWSPVARDTAREVWRRCGLRG